MAAADAQAVLQRSDGTVVFVVRDGARAERRNVRLGVFRDGLTEVVEGVALGEHVIVRGSSRLVDGSAVEVRGPDGKPIEILQAGSGVGERQPKMAGAPEPARSLP